MPEDLTTKEVCRCLYIWGKKFIDTDLYEKQKTKEHFIKAWKTGHWNSEVKSFIRAMLHTHVGHFRFAIAVWQCGLPLTALNMRVSGAAEHGSHDAAGRTDLDQVKLDIQKLVDFIIAVGKAETDYQATKEYEAAVRNMDSYKQSPAHTGNKAARKALRAKLQEAEELLEQRDNQGLNSFDCRQQNLLHDYETNKLHRQLHELPQGCEPKPPFFRISDIPAL